MLKEFRTARYQKQLNKVSGIFKAPPELVNQIARWAAKDFAEHVLYYVNLGLQTDQRPNKAFSEMRNIILKELMNLDILKGSYEKALRELNSLRVGETMKVQYSDEYRAFAESHDLSAYKDLSITRTSEDEYYAISLFKEIPAYKTYKKDGSTGNLQNAIQLALIILSDELHYILSIIDKDKKPFQYKNDFATTDNSLVELSLLRKKCYELGAEMPKTNSVTERTIKVNLKNWVYNDLLDLSIPERENVSEDILKFREALTEMFKLRYSDEKSTKEIYFENMYGKIQSLRIEKDTKTPLKYYLYVDGNLSPEKSLPSFMIERAIENAFFHKLTEKEKEKVQEDIHVEKRRLRFKYDLGDKLEKKMSFLRLNELKVVMIYNYKMPSLGAWYPKERKIALRPYILAHNIKTIEDFNSVLSELISTIEHEVQHYGQSVLTEMRALKEDEGLGLSPPELRSKEYYPTGVNREDRKAPQQEHPLRDIEYHTNLGSTINYLNRMKRKIHKKLFKYFVAVHIGVETITPKELGDITNKNWEKRNHDISKKYNIPTSLLEELIYDYHIKPGENFLLMKEKDPKRWRAVVSEIIKEVL